MAASTRYEACARNGEAVTLRRLLALVRQRSGRNCGHGSIDCSRTTNRSGKPLRRYQRIA
eukprot:CAMPEP_0115344238 /NCGR_PEP_ID=MMETSP0270-20121206/93162_1 /TAXON_ID=71861 /ORGANISM="Scrippsiella trochoidea, Strain CCMP3099" /LENGTH=59 /DNA_ID=CAMNT_0002765923 /DNA_START=12 /DNA_END=187 /DNA_ORIENTATION=+